jgi:tetratricopeptide (TPR) repeat protein
VLGRCVDLCRAFEFRLVLIPAAAALASVLAHQGRGSEALALAEEVASGLASRRVWAEEDALVSLGSACLRAGRADAADAWVRQALEASRRHGARGPEAHALRLLGEIASHLDAPDIESAEAHYRQGMAVAAELGMRPLQAHCHLGLGKLYRGIGKRQEAREHLATATMMYREMDMRFWLEQAEAELRELA